MSKVPAIAMLFGLLAFSGVPPAEGKCIYQDALEAVRDLYLRPLGQSDLLVELQTEGMDSNLSEDRVLVWVNVRRLTDCGPDGKPTVLRVMFSVHDGRIEGFHATGSLLGEAERCDVDCVRRREAEAFRVLHELLAFDNLLSRASTRDTGVDRLHFSSDAAKPQDRDTRWDALILTNSGLVRSAGSW